jgi:hypothetical protein
VKDGFLVLKSSSAGPSSRAASPMSTPAPT